jgi:hypothetical protein
LRARPALSLRRSPEVTHPCSAQQNLVREIVKAEPDLTIPEAWEFHGALAEA